MTKIYIYKMTVDNGGAPCVSGDILSLAICKPAIRSTAESGNIILGFAGNDLYKDNRLIYVARVTDKLDSRNYSSESRYAARPDSIYQWDGRRFQWKSGSKFHLPSDLEHDLGQAPDYDRANVLLSEGMDNFRYFGANCPVDYKRYLHLKLLIGKLGRAYRVHNFEPEVQQELNGFTEELLRTTWVYRETATPNSPCPDKCSDADNDYATGDCQ